MVDELLILHPIDHLKKDGEDVEADTEDGEYEIIFSVDDDGVCLICIEELDMHGPYAIIDDCDENSKYHIGCLEEWFKFSNHGIICRGIVKTYSIYHDEEFIEKRNIDILPKSTLVSYRGYSIQNNEPTIFLTDIAHMNRNQSMCDIREIKKFIFFGMFILVFIGILAIFLWGMID